MALGRMLDLYTDFLISSDGLRTATGMSAMLDGMVSHDQVTRFLGKEDYDSRTLWKEVKKLLYEGYDPTLPALQALGYKEIIAHIKGLMDWDATVELIKKRTRNFAKRQLTWYRSFTNAHWEPLDL